MLTRADEIIYHPCINSQDRKAIRGNKELTVAKNAILLRTQHDG